MFAHLLQKMLKEFAYIWQWVNLTVKKVLLGRCEPSMGISAPSFAKQVNNPPTVSRRVGVGGRWCCFPSKRHPSRDNANCSFLFLSAFIIELRAALHSLNSPDSQNFCSARAAQEINVFKDGVASAPTSLSWSRSKLQVRCWAVCTQGSWWHLGMLSHRENVSFVGVRVMPCTCAVPVYA